MLAWLIPPLAVHRRAGHLGTAFWIACVLTLLGYLPGALFARAYTRRRPKKAAADAQRRP